MQDAVDGVSGTKEQGRGTVARRRVFYIAGFDPFPPRRYRELYRRESTVQARISGHRIAVTAAGGDGWSVRATIAGAEVLTDITVLVWADIVQRSMGQGIAATYAQALRTVWVYVGSGAIWRLLRLRRGPAVAALYPVAALALQLLGALSLGWLAARLVAGSPPFGLAPAGLAGPGWTRWAGAALAGVAVAWLVLAAFRRMDHRLYAHYLMHDYAFTAQSGGAMPAALRPRVAEFAARIARALADPAVDEVLVIGHSSGAHIAVSALAEVVRDAGADPRLSLLTLGQVVPMVSFLPRAGDLRADLALLAADGPVWVDVTAPGDGCAFALCDPVAVSGVSPPGKRWPLVISAAFAQTLSATRLRALRRRWFRLHFQYLCAFDALPGMPWDYDYFAITAGPLRLGARFAGRPPSRSRIETPLSGHRGMTPPPGRTGGAGR